VREILARHNGIDAPRLTPSQARVLATARERGELRQNSIARRPIERLRDLGLVTFHIEVQPDALHGRHRHIYVVRPTETRY